jgi:hypothetical protein
LIRCEMCNYVTQNTPCEPVPHKLAFVFILLLPLFLQLFTRRLYRVIPNPLKPSRYFIRVVQNF